MLQILTQKYLGKAKFTAIVRNSCARINNTNSYAKVWNGKCSPAVNQSAHLTESVSTGC